MKILRLPLLVALLATSLLAQSSDPVPPLPAPITNNAIAVYKTRSHDLLFSIMGLGKNKTWDAVSSKAYMLDSDLLEWNPLPLVPGAIGRVAAMSTVVKDQVYVLGGAVIDAQKRESFVSGVNVFDPVSMKWYRGKDIPIPVADSVVGVYRDRYIFLIGGRTDSGPVSTVQVYDTNRERWFQATSMPYAVYGHSGAMMDDTILYIDGATMNPDGKPLFVATDQCWIGKVNHKDPSRIDWNSLPNHPGSARFRTAAGASEKDHKIYFTGGSDIPYSDNGIGYNGSPAEPSPVTFDYDLHEKKWETINENTPHPLMDAHDLIVTPDGLLVLGGMEAGQKVTAQVTFIKKQTPPPPAPQNPKNNPSVSPAPATKPATP